MFYNWIEDKKIEFTKKKYILLSYCILTNEVAITGALNFFPCGCKLLCSVLSIHSEGHSLVFLVEQACWQEILSLFIWECPTLPFILEDSFARYRSFG